LKRISFSKSNQLFRIDTPQLIEGVPFDTLNDSKACGDPGMTIFLKPPECATSRLEFDLNLVGPHSPRFDNPPDSSKLREPWQYLKASIHTIHHG
jgi:hypothetical protein